MDSFYGAPRQPPAPPTINPIHRIPMVPEVSMLENQHRPLWNKNDFHPISKLEDLNKKQVRFQNNEPLIEKENQPQVLKSIPDLNGKTFKQIYMANVPDRHLDLSIFEPSDKSFPVVTNKPPPKNALTSIENSNFDLVLPRKYPKNLEISTQTSPMNEPCKEIATKTDEPTIRDLFKIIQQQNEQIMLLQQQVNNLKTTVSKPEIEPPPFLKETNNSPKNKGLFSFNVKATSCEFSFRPPQHKYRKQNDYLEPTIEEILEGENTDKSLKLDKSVEVKDSYLSTMQSIAIEMDKYHSSDEDEEDPQVGLSFYQDLMKQVNNALKRAQQSNCQDYGSTMNAVKQATLQHLQNIGVNLSPIQESSEFTQRSDLDEKCNQSEVSCAVQQLLMKYLPPDKLAKVVHQPKKPVKELKPEAPYEFSFATLQYMKKYNLLNNKVRGGSSQERFLKNVTALKMQPKLPQQNNI